MKTLGLGVCVGVCGFLLLAELLCQLLPVSSSTAADYYIDPRIRTYAAHLSWRYATGWDLRNPQRLTTNGHGFVSEHEFTRNQAAIALIGDSYVEAASLDAADRPAAQLERALDARRPVYAMGSAGTSLLDYAERIRYAHEQFGIHDFVVLMERGDVLQSICGSGNIASQCLDAKTLAPRTETAPPSSGLKRVLRHSALAQYFVSQLKVAPASMLRQMFSRPEAPAAPAPARAPQTPPAPTPEIEAIAGAFFARVQPHVAGRLVLVLDADRRALMQHRSPDDPQRQRFMELARAAGATVVDTEPLFRQHFAISTLSLDMGPYDGHFNRLGVQLVAGAAAEALRRASAAAGPQAGTK
jgi:hypothetical protein